MNILVVVGYCLKVNSSANLCHLSYINGLLNLGYDIDLVTVSEKGQKVDDSMKIPENVNVYKYDCSLYELLASKKNKETVHQMTLSNDNEIEKISFKRKLINACKSIFKGMYGKYGFEYAWCKHAMKFKSNKEYDLVISLAYPPVSHLLVQKLSSKKRIKYKHWIQIWEDPWALDLFGEQGKKEDLFNKEKNMLSFAEKVCYVSPLTLMYQQKMFPEYADKMYWQPLPSYYTCDEVKHYSNNKYGYFGDFVPSVRNLKTFYDVAVDNGLYVNICGNPVNYLMSNKNVNVHPRMPLNELKKYEDETNVLIFLCNLKGGQIPGKIYQYSASYKTILFILDGSDEEKETLKNFFSKFNRYVFCDNNYDSISNAIDLIESGNLGDIINKPIDEFNPERIIENIIKEGTK